MDLKGFKFTRPLIILTCGIRHTAPVKPDGGFKMFCRKRVIAGVLLAGNFQWVMKIHLPPTTARGHQDHGTGPQAAYPNSRPSEKAALTNSPVKLYGKAIFQ